MQETLEGDRPVLVALFAGPNRLVLAAALWLSLCCNGPFWRAAAQATGGWQNGIPWFLGSLALVVLLCLFLLLSLLCWGRLTKPMLASLLLLSAAASYFMDSYGIVIDHGMLTNLLQTDVREATELLSWKLVAWLLGFGALPAWALSRVRLTRRPLLQRGSRKLLTVTVAALGLAGLVLSQYPAYASLARNHRELRLMLTPFNLLAATHGYVKRQAASAGALQTVGVDARREGPAATARKPRLLVLVVGETARAANFSLNGYARDTNSELDTHSVLSFANVRSCGTATAVSLPCMFLDVGRDGYEDGQALSRESLLDVLQHAGLTVLWRDNNSGCKGVCDRVPHEALADRQVMGLCRQDECYDEILLHGLQAYLDRQRDDTVVVLHMKGSHGPAYAKRYPLAFERYAPVCDGNQLDRCDRQSIVNAYDNSLRYTSHVLGRAINLLQRNNARFDAGMLYVSDHGESLGESGLYLHGLPYIMAPSEQTHIPLLLWLSEGLARSRTLDTSCLAQAREQPLSHDNLFHSVLGLMAVRTDAYRAERDLFRRCTLIGAEGSRLAAAPQGGRGGQP